MGAGGFGVDPPPPGLGEVPVGGFGGLGGAGGFGGGGLPGSSFQSPPVVTSGVVPEPPGVTFAVTTGATTAARTVTVNVFDGADSQLTPFSTEMTILLYCVVTVTGAGGS